MLASLNFCADGVLEKFPKLKVAYLESGCGWLPFWLERMDEHWEHEGHGRPKLPRTNRAFTSNASAGPAARPAKNWRLSSSSTSAKII